MAESNPSRRENSNVQRSGVTRPALLIFCAVLLAGALLVVVLNFDREDAGTIPIQPSEDIEEYVPRPLSDEELAGRNTSDDPQVLLEQGAWVEVADEQGRLIQKYRAKRIEPLADGMIDLLEPVAVMFLSNGRILTLEGNLARAKRRENDVIETGRVSGTVRIRLFDPIGDVAPKYLTDSPSVYIETEDATFDNISGLIECPGDVRVRTDTFEFFGRGLVTRYDDENGLQFLHTEETLGPIRIAAGAVDRMNAGANDGESTLEEPVQIVWQRGRLAQDAPPSESGEDSLREQTRRRNRNRPIDETPAFSVDTSPLYEAIFEDEVHIWRGDAEEANAEQVILGDRLRAVFTMENSRLEGDSPEPPVEIFRSSFEVNWRATVAASILAAVSQESPAGPRDRDAIMPPPTADDLRITHTGPLTIAPLEGSVVTLADENDVHLEVTGTPSRLLDRSSDAAALCNIITYTTASDTAILLGSDDHPFTLHSPELDATGEQLEYEFALDHARFVRAGTMNLHRTAEPDSAGGQTSPGRDALRIAWSEGVELQFTPAPDDPQASHESRLEEATFRGEVAVADERFTMKSDQLYVAFDAEGAARDDIQRIEATGSVDAQGLDERGGRLTADAKRIEFERDPDTERMQPTRMIATGQAHLEDVTQAIDAHEVIAHLVPRAESPESTDSGSPGRLGDVEVKTFYARESVRIALDNGTVATGDELTAQVRENIADLTGNPVVVDGANEDVDFHAQGLAVHIEPIEEGRSKLTLRDEVTAQIRNYGAVKGIEVIAGDVIAPQELPPNEQMEPVSTEAEPASRDEISPQIIDVACADRLEYLEPDALGNATLELFETVRAKSTAPLEDSSVESEYLRLDFVETTDPAEEVVDGADQAEEIGSRRTLKRMVAKGDARLESRSWLTPQRAEGDLRIVFISGQHVEFDQENMTAEVPGAGELLLVDQRTAEPAGAEIASQDGLTGKGKTVFTWTGRMEMRQIDEGIFSMHLEDDAMMIHQSMFGPEHDSTLTSDTLDVEFGRRGPEERVAAVDFGGAMEIRMLDAIGAVHATAMQKEIDAARLT